MLKEDALKKKCPFLMAGGTPLTSATSNCLADGCMAWISAPQLKDSEQGRCGMVPPALNAARRSIARGKIVGPLQSASIGKAND